MLAINLEKKVTKTSNAIDVHFQNRSCEEFRIFMTKRRFITDNTLQNKEAIALNGIITGIVDKKHPKSCLMQS